MNNTVVVAIVVILTRKLFSYLNVFPPHLLLHPTDNEYEPPRRILNYIEYTIPGLNDQQFQQHFRLKRQTFEELISIVHNKIKKPDGLAGKTRMDTERQLLAVLWLLSTPDSYRSVGERFNMNKSSLSVAFFRIIKALCDLAPQVISWPENLEEVSRGFERMAGLKGVVGAIDGTFVPIKAPQEHPEVYITRKCHYAITLQAICDDKLKFTDCYVGWPGSVSDTRIFYNSDIYLNIMRNRFTYFPNNEYIIGDKAYTVLSWCIPPYINRGGLNAAQINFNTKLSQTRQTIERAFALLFGRYRRLKFLDMHKTECISFVVLACTVLHNLCISEDNIEEYINEGALYVEGAEGNIEFNVDRALLQDQIEGNAKRNRLCVGLFR